MNMTKRKLDAIFSSRYSVKPEKNKRQSMTPDGRLCAVSALWTEAFSERVSCARRKRRLAATTNSTQNAQNKKKRKN